jgi:hypothetical protein
MALLRRLLAKQKADREEAERKRLVRLEKRRGYARAARERERAKQNGLADLPVEVAVAIEQTPAMPTPEPVKVELVPVEELIARLTAIRERLFWLQAVWANTLSPHVYYEAESYRILFQDLSEPLRGQDPAALDRIVAGHEALLLSEPGAPKPIVPLAPQKLFELAAETQSSRSVRPATNPSGYVADGLQGFL